MVKEFTFDSMNGGNMASNVSFLQNGSGLGERQLQLTEVESTLRRLLLDVANYVNPANPSELRYTGGWVRDKLLGIASHDIDVSINNMTGYQFGLKMKQYLELPGISHKYRLQRLAEDDGIAHDAELTANSNMVQGLHKIEANPEKSKHLETVTTKIFGLDVDLVNLRKETYTDDSRNPQMEFGTAEEDALRRDATINALFYNLQTQIIEDLTGRGFNDMNDKVIRTPLEPYQTFKDDPLRVLRLIRFASRLGYSIDPIAEEVMHDKQIKQALKVKISRERVGVEVEKMMKGPDPRMALQLIDRLDLYQTIFADPTNNHEFVPETQLWHLAYDCAAEVLDESQTQLRIVLVPDEEHKYLAWVLSAFVPFADAPMSKSLHKGGKTPLPIATTIAREGIKANNKICDILTASIRNMDDFIGVKDKFIRSTKTTNPKVSEEDPRGRDTLGMAIRRWGPSWRSQAVFAMMTEVSRSGEFKRDIIKEYTSFVLYLDELGLQSAYDLKPIVDGKALAEALGTHPGPWMKDALDIVMAWQLRHQDTTTKEDAIEAVKNKHGELTTSLVRHFLTLTIRPLFEKTQTHNVTAQGRRVTASKGLPRKYEGIEDEAITRPWKAEKESSALDLLSWVIKCLDQKLTEQTWPLLIPPLLTLVDDVDTRYKARGCEYLTGLFSATSSALMARTGLGEVFETAMVPCLSYLPTLTPEEESITLLNAAYPAFFSLAAVRYPARTPTTNIAAVYERLESSRNHTRIQPPSTERVKFLIRILHSHILPSISHVSEYPRIVAALLNHVATVLYTLGINAVSHMMYVLPLLTAQLTAPFAAACPPLLTSATKALQAVLANAWPRVYLWRGEILKGLCGCWMNASEEQFDDTIKQGFKLCVQMLVNAVDATAEHGKVEDNADVDIRVELLKLVEADTRLGGLLGEFT